MSENLVSIGDDKENMILSKNNEESKLLNKSDVQKISIKLVDDLNIMKTSKSITKKFTTYKKFLEENNLEDIEEDSTTKVKDLNDENSIDIEHNYSYYNKFKKNYEHNFLNNINSNLNKPQITTLNKLNDNLSIKRFNDTISIDKDDDTFIMKDYSDSYLFYNFYFLKKPIIYDWEDKIIYKNFYKEMIRDSLKNTIIFDFFKKNCISVNNDLFNFLMQASNKFISNSVFENINFKEFLSLINEVFEHITYYDRKLLDICIKSIKVNYFTADSRKDKITN